MGRGEDKLEPIGNLSQIISGLFGDVSRVVVEHHTNLGRWGILLVHPLEEGNKLSTTMTVHHLAMHSAGEQVNTPCGQKTHADLVGQSTLLVSGRSRQDST